MRPVVVNKSGVPPFGLKYIPTLEPSIHDRDESAFKYCITHNNSINVIKLVRLLVDNLNCKRILEIGVAEYSPEHSITWEVLKNKKEAYYYGVDIADRADVLGQFKYTTFIRTSSKKQELVRKIVPRPIDILIIDGVHNVNFCINDWKYVDLLRKGGIVLIHDTNNHPGPYAVVDAIDRDKFFVLKMFENDFDNGITIAIKKV